MAHSSLELLTPNMIDWFRFGAGTLSMRLKVRVKTELEDVQDNPSLISVTSSTLILVPFGIQDDKCNGKGKTAVLSLPPCLSLHPPAAVRRESR